MGAVRELRVAIEHPDIIQPEKSALEDVVALGIFAVHPPGERDQHFVEDGFQKRAIAFTGLFSLDLINAPRRPGQHRRIDIAEVPFVGGNLPIWMLVPFAHDDIELHLGELGIDQGQRNTMKSEVPGCIPGKFPFVRH